MLKLIIIGLGNIGFKGHLHSKYNKTPHNIGFNIISNIAKKYKISITRCPKYLGAYGEKIITIENQDIILGIFYPYTMMNLSGHAVKKIVTLLDSLDHMLVCTDNKDLPVGNIKYKTKGKSKHHNGIASIDSCLFTLDKSDKSKIIHNYPRIRIGTGNTDVLSNMSPEDIELCVDNATIVCEKWIRDCLDHYK
jgi:peptidyl-tRNA hydrolase, PTH1 family